MQQAKPTGDVSSSGAGTLPGPSAGAAKSVAPGAGEGASKFVASAGAGASPPSQPQGQPSGAVPEPAERAAKLERLLEEIHGKLDAVARDRAHRPFSISWLIGSLLQVLVIGLLVLAALDWVFQKPRFEIGVLIKLGFAITLQLIAVTAFVLGRED